MYLFFKKNMQKEDREKIQVVSKRVVLKGVCKTCRN